MAGAITRSRMNTQRSPKLDRRLFFRDAVARAMEPLANYVEKRMAAEPLRFRLRPPGAVPEASFVETCYRCGACVEACPADAIFPLARPGAAAGTPVIDPDRAACVVCDGLHCTKVCPSGALQTLNDPHSIRMGLAEVYEPLCVRSRGESCTLCVDRCPIGESAIRFDGAGPPSVSADGCVGCGVCQHECPTTPKAIVVKPC